MRPGGAGRRPGRLRDATSLEARGIAAGCTREVPILKGVDVVTRDAL